MKLTKKLLALLLILAMVIPAQAATGKVHESHGEPPLPQAMESTNQIRPLATPVALKHPSKAEIIAKSKTVTSSQTIFLTEPSVVAPYATGSLTEEFMQTGLTYLNYVRFVAGLPEITLDDAMNLDAQHGAVVLAAIDELTHYPSQPADMDDAFFQKGYAATSSSNISYRWGYDPLGNLKNSILGCMNDNGSIGNLTTVGHRRWLLNPTLGKVGFGYAESNSGASYIVTKVFDWSGVGCTFDFISWPAAGNQPVDLFPAQNPWSVTLNNSVYRKASADSVKITVTRESDGTQWIFDGSTGKPNTNIDPYLIVDTQGYGIPNCIIFHPGTANVRNYEGVYTVKITGIYYLNGSAAEINYTVDFFDINSYCPDHNYTPTVTAPTCTEQGYITYTCSACGDSYISDYVGSLGHAMGNWYTTKEATCTNDGEQRRDCSRCDHYETQVITSSGHHFGDDTVCDNCGFDSTAPEYPENALMLSGEEFAGQDTVWIEGLPYPVEDNGVSRYVELPTEDDCYMVTYTYHTGDASDIHTQYPTGMKVYKISDGEITHIPQLDNLLQYSGASIRITGKKGIRMITSLTKTNKTALTGKGLAGFKLLEYGTALCFAHEIPQGDALVLGRDFTRSNYAYKKGVADPVFASTKDLIQYTNVLVGFSLDQCKDDIAMRPYIILEDAAGNQITLYGGTIYRSIGYIAYQNRTVFKPKTASYNYVWELIHHVYGDKYDADYKG